MGNVAFVLSGGGAKGSFELGALDYLIRDQHIDPKVIVGVSTGNLNAAMLAQGQGHAGLLRELETLEQVWFGLKENDDVYYERFPGIVAKLLGAIFKADSLYSNKPLWKLIQKHVDPDKLRKSGRILRVGVVGLMTGEYFAADGSYAHIREMVRASASIPVYFNPVDLTQASGRVEKFVDGGVRDVTPLGTAFGALKEARGLANVGETDTIYLILASPLRSEVVEDPGKMDSGIDIMGRSLSLLINEIYRNDLEIALNINSAVQYYQKLKNTHQDLLPGFPFEKYECANIILIEPEREYLDSLEFNPAKIRAAFDAGRTCAQLAFAKAQALNGSNIDLAQFGGDSTILRS